MRNAIDGQPSLPWGWPLAAIVWRGGRGWPSPVTPSSIRLAKSHYFLRCTRALALCALVCALPLLRTCAHQPCCVVSARIPRRARALPRGLRSFTGDGNLSEPLSHWHVSKGAVAGLINPPAKVCHPPSPWAGGGSYGASYAIPATSLQGGDGAPAASRPPPVSAGHQPRSHGGISYTYILARSMHSTPVLQGGNVTRVSPPICLIMA